MLSNNNTNNNNRCDISYEDILQGRVYYYCRLKNDSDAIIIPSADVSTSMYNGSNVTKHTNYHHSRSGNDPETIWPTKKRTLQQQLPVVPAATTGSRSEALAQIRLDVPFVGWIFEISSSSSSISSCEYQHPPPPPLNPTNSSHIPTWSHNSNIDHNNHTTSMRDCMQPQKQRDNNNNQHRYYAILCIPQYYESVLWQACMNQSMVHIQHHTIIPMQQQQPLLVHMNDTNHHNNNNNIKPINCRSTVSYMICIPMHSPGCETSMWVDHDNDGKQRQSIVMNQHHPKEPRIHNGNWNDDDDEVWTLEQLARNETLDAIETKDFGVNKHPKPLQKKKRKYSLMGRVTTISPLLSVQGKDPFVLLEMIHSDKNWMTTITETTTDSCDHQEINLQFHCVVVFRREGLLCHSSIVPNDTILILRQVRKQQWKMPELFEKETQQSTTMALTTTTTPPPSSVFVVDFPHQIELIHATTKKYSHNNDNNINGLYDSRISSPPMISKVTSITGLVHKVHSQSSNHMLEIITASTMTITSQETIYLYISHYPMSTSLSLLLQLFTMVVPQQNEEESSNISLEIHVHVINAQCLGYRGYAANLYTTIAIDDIVCNTDTNTSMPVEQPVTQCVSAHRKKGYNLMQLSDFPIPYDIVEQPKSTYERVWIHDLVCTNIFDISSFGPKVPVPLDLIDQATDRLWSVISQTNTYKQSPRAVRRNVYIDFFTRPKYRISNVNQIHTLAPIINLPYPISITAMQKCTFRAMREQLYRMVQTHPTSMKIGWAGAKQFIGPSLYEIFVPKEGCGPATFDSERQLMYTFGRRLFATRHGQNKVIQYASSISDGRVTIPMVFVDGSAAFEPPDSTGRSTIADNALVWVSIKGVVVSSMYLGATPSRSGRHDSKCKAIPSYSSTDRDSSVADTHFGACGICVVKGHIFMISVYMICDRCYAVGQGNIESHIESTFCKNISTISLEKCLNPERWNEAIENAASVVALLVRGKFKLGKVKTNGYSSYSMALAHISIDQSDDASEVFSTLQCVDMKPSIALDPSKRRSLQCQVDSLLEMDSPLSQEILTLGVVWWKIACCPWTCAIQGGGWDQSVQKNNNSKMYGVVVCIPFSSICRDSKRGYTRIRCDMQYVVASVRWLEQSDNHRSGESTLVNQWFDFIGGSDKFLPGVLDRRPRRRQFGNLAYGECLTNPRTTLSNPNLGVPRNSLSDLSVLLCRELQSTTGRCHLAPSLTREIRDASFLGIGYCRARAECSQCYESLYNPNDKSNTTISQSANVNHNVPARRSDQSETLLRCPNGCRVDLNGSIKWECSGTIDDGTGQAKLYAEREAAICLLGLSSTVLQTIESAIWESNRVNGYIYLKTAPPPSYIRTAVVEARAMAKQNIRQRDKDVRNMNDADVVQYMSKSHYGEYLFHVHCRTSFEPLRSLIYYVRCKPLSDSISTLSQTEIDINAPSPRHRHNNHQNVVERKPSTTGISNDDVVRDDDGCNSRDDEVILIPTITVPTQSYTLPPINVNLVDCCCHPLHSMREM